MSRTKKYQEALKKIDKNMNYSLDEAVNLVKEVSYSKFDGSVELQITLNLKEKQKKESIKGTVTYPNVIGDVSRVAVIAEASDQKEAKAAGADEVGLDDLIEKIEKGWMEFDVLIATPETMPKVAKLGKFIGKQGLMPNPKSGTVTSDVQKAVKSFKAGKTSYKMIEGGIFQVKVGKISMEEGKIKENIIAFIKSLNSEVKKLGENIYKQVKIAPSMGPSIKLDVNSLLEEVK